MDKRLIAARFAKARETYDREARVQQQAAEKMMRMIAEVHPDVADLRRVVEVGCGTGIYSRILLETLRPQSLLLNDLCPEMEECVSPLCKGEACHAPTVRFLACDAEQMNFPPDTDLVTSCSTLQWFSDPATFFHRCRQALSADGLLAFSTFGRENLREIRQLTGHGLDYLSLEELKALLAVEFDILRAEEEVVPIPFPTPQAVLRHLKQTGVTGTEKRMWTRSRLASFSEAYKAQFSDAEGNVTLTYHPIYIIVQATRQRGDKATRLSASSPSIHKSLVTSLPKI